VKAATNTKPKKRNPRQRKPSQPQPGWLVYLLRCRDGSLYTGITNDLPKRLKVHAAGKASRYTRSRLPVSLTYTEPQASKSRALKREAAIKKLSRRHKECLIGTRQAP
jgi:predicted GIY-YIG superfamily endonuclease